MDIWSTLEIVHILQPSNMYLYLFLALIYLQFWRARAYMVLVLDGNLGHIAHAELKKVFLEEKKDRFVTALDLIKCLKQIKQQRLLPTCAPMSELQYNISTMMNITYVMYKKKYLFSSMHHGSYFIR